MSPAFLLLEVVPNLWSVYFQPFQLNNGKKAGSTVVDEFLIHRAKRSEI